MTKIMLNGMTDKKTADLALLARSWVMPPDLNITSPGYRSDGYDPSQRAYVITADKDAAALKFTIAASKDHPIANLPLLIKNWGPGQAVLTINGKSVTGNDCRKAHVDKLEGTNLVIWAKAESTTPLKLTITSPQ